MIEEGYKKTAFLGGPEHLGVFVSDHQSLVVLQVANSLGIKVPHQLGIFGFANEAFLEIIRPSLSSVDQKSKQIGKHTAELYFNSILSKRNSGFIEPLS